MKQVWVREETLKEVNKVKKEQQWKNQDVVVSKGLELLKDKLK